MTEGSAKHLVRVWVWEDVSGYVGLLDGFCQHTKLAKFSSLALKAFAMTTTIAR